MFYPGFIEEAQPLYDHENPAELDITILGEPGAKVQSNKGALLLRCRSDHPLWLEDEEFKVGQYCQGALDEFERAVRHRMAAFEHPTAVAKLWRCFNLHTLESAQQQRDEAPRPDVQGAYDRQDILQQQLAYLQRKGVVIPEWQHATAFVPPAIFSGVVRRFLHPYRHENGPHTTASLPRPCWNPYLNRYASVRRDLEEWAVQINWKQELLDHIFTSEGKKYLPFANIDPRVNVKAGFVLYTHHYGPMTQYVWASGAYLNFIEFQTGARIVVDGNLGVDVRSFYIWGTSASVGAAIEVILGFTDRVEGSWIFDENIPIISDEYITMPLDIIKKHGEVVAADFFMPCCINPLCDTRTRPRAGHIEKTCSRLRDGTPRARPFSEYDWISGQLLENIAAVYEFQRVREHLVDKYKVGFTFYRDDPLLLILQRELRMLPNLYNYPARIESFLRHRNKHCLAHLVLNQRPYDEIASILAADPLRTGPMYQGRPSIKCDCSEGREWPCVSDKYIPPTVPNAYRFYREELLVTKEELRQKSEGLQRKSEELQRKTEALQQQRTEERQARPLAQVIRGATSRPRTSTPKRPGENPFIAPAQTARLQDRPNPFRKPPTSTAVASTSTSGPTYSTPASTCPQQENQQQLALKTATATQSSPQASASEQQQSGGEDHDISVDQVLIALPSPGESDLVMDLAGEVDEEGRPMDVSLSVSGEDSSMDRSQEEPRFDDDRYRLCPVLASREPSPAPPMEDELSGLVQEVLWDPLEREFLHGVSLGPEVAEIGQGLEEVSIASGEEPGPSAAVTNDDEYKEEAFLSFLAGYNVESGVDDGEEEPRDGEETEIQEEAGEKK